MKIVFLGPAYPYRGGPASFTDRLARQFIDEGHEAEVHTFSLQYPAFLFPGKTQYTDKRPPDNLSIIRSLSSVNPLNWIILGIRLRRQRPDILLLRFWLPFFGPSFGTVARIVRGNGQTRVICIFDNVIPHEKRVGDRLLTRFFTGSIDGAIVMSESVRVDLGKFRSDIPVSLSPHPLFDNYGEAMSRKEALKALELDADYSHILFFGFIRAYKGLDLLIEALADASLVNRKLKLIVAGEFYEDPKPYKDIIRAKGLEGKIILYERFIRDEEVAVFFSAADLVVQPYRSATQSGVTQVAFHYNKPMVVTDVGGLGEIVADGVCGYVVKPEPGQIAGAIADFFDKSRAGELGEGVMREKGKFAWDKMTDSILKVYKRLISRAN